MEDIPDIHGRRSDQTPRHANPTQSKGAGFFVRNFRVGAPEDPGEFDRLRGSASLSEPGVFGEIAIAV